MSTGLNCLFVRYQGQWYYVLESDFAPKNAWDWREYADAYGPFPSKEAAIKNLDENFANPGGWGVIDYDSPDVRRPDDTIKGLLAKATVLRRGRGFMWNPDDGGGCTRLERVAGFGGGTRRCGRKVKAEGLCALCLARKRRTEEAQRRYDERHRSNPANPPIADFGPGTDVTVKSSGRPLTVEGVERDDPSFKRRIVGVRDRLSGLHGTVFGDLDVRPRRSLMQQLSLFGRRKNPKYVLDDDAIDCPHRASQHMGGACEKCTVKALKLQSKAYQVGPFRLAVRKWPGGGRRYGTEWRTKPFVGLGSYQIEASSFQEAAEKEVARMLADDRPAAAGIKGHRPVEIGGRRNPVTAGDGRGYNPRTRRWVREIELDGKTFLVNSYGVVMRKQKGGTWFGEWESASLAEADAAWKAVTGVASRPWDERTVIAPVAGRPVEKSIGGIPLWSRNPVIVGGDARGGEEAVPRMNPETFLKGKEDMGWLRDVHLPGLPKKYRFAVLTGNEDYPDRIEVYVRNNVNETPLVFTPDAEGNFRETASNPTAEEVPGVPQLNPRSRGRVVGNITVTILDFPNKKAWEVKRAIRRVGKPSYVSDFVEINGKEVTGTWVSLEDIGGKVPADARETDYAAANRNPVIVGGDARGGGEAVPRLNPTDSATAISLGLNSRLRGAQERPVENSPALGHTGGLAAMEDAAPKPVTETNPIDIPQDLVTGNPPGTPGTIKETQKATTNSVEETPGTTMVGPEARLNPVPTDPPGILPVDDAGTSHPRADADAVGPTPVLGNPITLSGDTRGDAGAAAPGDTGSRYNEGGGARPRADTEAPITRLNPAEKTVVIFRKWPKSEGGDVIALFPDIDAGGGHIQSYEHIGQHGGASRALSSTLKKASPKEYAELLKELHQIGYRNLDIRQRMPSRRNPMLGSGDARGETDAGAPDLSGSLVYGGRGGSQATPHLNPSPNIAKLIAKGRRGIERVYGSGEIIVEDLPKGYKVAYGSVGGRPKTVATKLNKPEADEIVRGLKEAAPRAEVVRIGRRTRKGGYPVTRGQSNPITLSGDTRGNAGAGAPDDTGSRYNDGGGARPRAATEGPVARLNPAVEIDVWFGPAEANGWRAEVRHPQKKYEDGHTLIATLSTKWFRTREEARSQARKDARRLGIPVATIREWGSSRKNPGPNFGQDYNTVGGGQPVPRLNPGDKGTCPHCGKQISVKARQFNCPKCHNPVRVE